MSTTTINKSIFLNAPRETVWAYLTEKDKLGVWFHPADADLAEGKPYALLGDAADSNSRMCWGDVLRARHTIICAFQTPIHPAPRRCSSVKWLAIRPPRALLDGRLDA